MSRMSELAQTLDDLTEVGQRLMACGEDMIRAAARVKDCFSDGSAEAQPQDPVKEPESEAKAPAPKTYTKEEVRALLANLSQSGFRSEAKALVRKYSDGRSLTDINPARYPELMEEARKYNA